MFCHWSKTTQQGNSGARNPSQVSSLFHCKYTRATGAHTPWTPHPPPPHPNTPGSKPVLFQTWVLWKHCKDCVQIQTNFTR